MVLDNLAFANSVLKIRRPKDYVPDENDRGAPHIPGHVSSNVPDSPNKVFIGGLPSYLNDEQVMELLKSFGELKAFNLVKENGDPDRSKVRCPPTPCIKSASQSADCLHSHRLPSAQGFAFCEYVDPEVTEIAIQGLNNMELGDRSLVVQRASVGSGGNAGGNRIGGGQNFGSGANGGGLGPVPAFAQDNGPLTSRAIVMLNMVTPDELTNDDDYEDILLDIKEECSKYGEVEQLRIPRPTKRARKVAGQLEKAEQSATDAARSDEDAGVGRVFVLFRTVEGAQAGVRAIAGRQFGGKTIICAALDEVCSLLFSKFSQKPRVCTDTWSLLRLAFPQNDFLTKRIGDTDVEPAAPPKDASPAPAPEDLY